MLAAFVVIGSFRDEHAIAQDKNKDAESDIAKSARDKFQGVWVFTEVIDCGQKVPDVDRDLMRFEFKANKVTLITQRAPKENPIAGSFSIDPKKSPAAMDITFDIEDGTKRTYHAIYEFKDGRLTICQSALIRGPRPSAFEATTKTVLSILEKQTKKK